MTIEQSHGKARPTLPRSSDLAVVETVRDPSEGRSEGGRFAAGNRTAVGARWKNACKKLLGSFAAGNPEAAAAVARDSWRLFTATMRDLPSDGAQVRQLAALGARHAALSAFFTARAADVGLDSEQGIAFGQLASHHGQRAERLAVTTLDLATKYASKTGAGADIEGSLRAAQRAFQKNLAAKAGGAP